MCIGYGLDRTLRRDASVSEDFPFWCYLFGLMAFWGGLTAMNSDSQLNQFIYLLINLGMILSTVWAQRRWLRTI
jgi:hypothetical protein